MLLMPALFLFMALLSQISGLVIPRHRPFHPSRQLLRCRSTRSDALQKANHALQFLSNRPRSLERFRDMMELAVDYAIQAPTPSTLADIGTDHGLLAASLALSQSFRSVTGVDVSLRALQDGAYRLHLEIATYRERNGLRPLALEFRHASGLQGLPQATVVCIAGMGVHTMLEILSAEIDGQRALDQIDCQRLLLQPTNCRPKNLILLHRSLADQRRHVDDERIAWINNRWYWTVSCRPGLGSDRVSAMPGGQLARQQPPNPIFTDYLNHHCRWLQQDLTKTGRLPDGEEEWLKSFCCRQ